MMILWKIKITETLILVIVMLMQKKGIRLGVVHVEILSRNIPAHLRCEYCHSKMSLIEIIMEILFLNNDSWPSDRKH